MHWLPDGAPLQESARLPVKPKLLVALKLYVAFCPGLIVTEAALPSEKSRAFPLTGMMSPELGRFVLTVNIPVTAPPLDGLKVT